MTKPTNKDLEIIINEPLLKWWIEILHEIYLDCPDRGIYQVYESMMGVLQKKRGEK